MGPAAPTVELAAARLLVRFCGRCDSCWCFHESSLPQNLRGPGSRAADGTGQEADGLGGRLTGQVGWPTDRAADGGRPAPSAARAAAQSWVGKLIEDSTVSFWAGQRVVTAFWRV